MNINEIRDALRHPDTISEQSFEIARAISGIRNTSLNQTTAQELILRALEYRELFGGSAVLIDGLVRESGLFPYMDVDSLSIKDQIAYEYHKPLNMESDNIVFHRVQGEVYRLLLSGENVVLSAPTSFGKSLIIDSLIATGNYNNIVIVVPTIALIDETRRRFSKFRDHFKIITHHSQEIEERNIFTFTQERVVDYEELPDIDFFVIDEFYKLSSKTDRQRGAILNHAFYRLLKTEAQFYLLGPNIQGISPGFAEYFKATFIHTDYNTVVSETHKISSFSKEKKEQKLLDLCATLAEPTLIYCSSPARANYLVGVLVQSGINAETPQLFDAADWVATEFHPDWCLVHGLRHGIGLHHGKIPRSLAHYMVKAFNEGNIRFLVCTSTLIEGVNTKAKNIVVYDNKVARKKFDFFTFNNIKGRSGRMFHHFVGNVYIFDEPPQEELPLVDIPLYTQGDDADDSLLIQIDEVDLVDKSISRLEPFFKQNDLELSVIKSNSGISPETQIELAKELTSKSEFYSTYLCWSGLPDYKELEMCCQLIWDFFVISKQRIAGVSSGRSLTYKINQLSRNPDVRSLISMESAGDPDKAVENVLDFIRHWGNYQFPRYLMALHRIQEFVFNRSGVKPGDYSYFATGVENLFLDPAIMALDEYGIPIQVGKKLDNILNPEGDLDKALYELGRVDFSKYDFTKFEYSLIFEAQKSI
ncbi:MAG: DEAD/DEAH box helicase [Candidatus Thiodiazotropha sp. (ex Lucinoma borealis)]|nr:DEAD/DEAH box helicase [Candidatus Thiodiazotropha sp. (ex Lucinoma borealis)]